MAHSGVRCAAGQCLPLVVSAALCPVNPFCTAQESTGASVKHPRGAQWGQQQEQSGSWRRTEAPGFPSPQEGLLVLVSTVSVFPRAAASSDGEMLVGLAWVFLPYLQACTPKEQELALKMKASAKYQGGQNVFLVLRVNVSE